jgi:hypothetical protein
VHRCNTSIPWPKGAPHFKSPFKWRQGPTWSHWHRFGKLETWKDSINSIYHPIRVHQIPSVDDFECGFQPSSSLAQSHSSTVRINFFRQHQQQAAAAGQQPKATKPWINPVPPSMVPLISDNKQCVRHVGSEAVRRCDATRRLSDLRVVATLRCCATSRSPRVFATLRCLWGALLASSRHCDPAMLPGGSSPLRVFATLRRCGWRAPRVFASSDLVAGGRSLLRNGAMLCRRERRCDAATLGWVVGGPACGRYRYVLA